MSFDIFIFLSWKEFISTKFTTPLFKSDKSSCFISINCILFTSIQHVVHIHQLSYCFGQIILLFSSILHSNSTKTLAFLLFKPFCCLFVTWMFWVKSNSCNVNLYAQIKILLSYCCFSVEKIILLALDQGKNSNYFRFLSFHLAFKTFFISTKNFYLLYQNQINILEICLIFQSIQAHFSSICFNSFYFRFFNFNL